MAIFKLFAHDWGAKTGTVTVSVPRAVSTRTGKWVRNMDLHRDTDRDRAIDMGRETRTGTPTGT